MATAFGHNSFVGFAPEATYGTYVPATKFLETLNEKFKGDQKFISKPSLRSISQDRRVLSKRTVTGGFDFQFGYAGAELLLKHVLGSASTTGSGPYVHTITPATTLPTGLSFYVHRDQAAITGSSAFRYYGCQIQSLTLKQEAEDFLICSLDVVGREWANGAAETATFPTFVGAHWADFSMTAGGQAMTVNSAEIKFENALATDRYPLGSTTRRGLGRSGARKATFSITKEFESLTEYQVWSGRTIQDYVFTWQASASNKLTITFRGAHATSGEPEVSDAGPVMVTITGEAYQYATANDEVSVELTNSVTTIP